MNTDTTAAAYFKRCIRDLGLQANDTERALIWAYDNPPRRPLPKSKSTREWSLFIERQIGLCLKSVAGDENISGLANAILRQWIQDSIPEMWSMFQRHEQELEARIAELRRNEPNLQMLEEV